MDSGLLELNLNFNMKIEYRPNTLTNFQKDITEIDKFCDKLMNLNDNLFSYKQKISRIQREHHEMPNPMFVLIDAIETLELDVKKMKQNSTADLVSNERFRMDFSSEIKKNDDSDLQETMDLDNDDGSLYYPSPKLFMNPKKDVWKTEAHRLRKSKLSVQPPPVTVKQELAIIPKRSGKEVGDQGRPAVGRIRWINAYEPAALHPVRVQFNAIIAKPATQKRFRRNWTRSLHLKFLHAVRSLGGPEVAKPRRIKELMKIEGMTNEQVKSHLQKYRKQLIRNPAAMEEEEEEEEVVEQGDHSDAESVAEGGGASELFFNGYKYIPYNKCLPKAKLNVDDGDTFSSNAN